MPEKDPLTYSLLTYVWILLISVWGGLINYYQKIKNGNVARFSIVEFIGELVTSAFAGVMTFYLCEAAGVPSVLTAGLVGIAGHMGSRTIYIFERILQKKLDPYLQQKVKQAKESKGDL